jgi:hypothetical protein
MTLISGMRAVLLLDKGVLSPLLVGVPTTLTPKSCSATPGLDLTEAQQPLQGTLPQAYCNELKWFRYLHFDLPLRFNLLHCYAYQNSACIAWVLAPEI